MEILSARDLQAQTDQTELLIWFLSRTGLPLLVVAGAMEEFSPQVPMFVLSDSSDIPEGMPQTVDAVITSADGPPILLSMLQPASVAEPIRIVPREDPLIPKVEFDSNPLRVVDDLKSLIDSFPLAARKHLIAEVLSVLAELTSAK